MFIHYNAISMECNYKYLEFVTTTQQQNYANSFTKVQPKHPWCKKERLRTKKGLDGKDAKSNWVAKASCC